MAMMITAIAMDEEMMEEVFAEMCEALGYGAWYECEDAWEEMEEIMVGMGFDEEMVSAFFSEMAWDL